MNHHHLYFLSSYPLRSPHLYESGITDLLLLNPEVNSLIHLTENPSNYFHSGPISPSSFSSLGPHDNTFSVFQIPHYCISQSLLLAQVLDPPGFKLWISSLLFPSLSCSPFILHSPLPLKHPILFSTLYPVTSCGLIPSIHSRLPNLSNPYLFPKETDSMTSLPECPIDISNLNVQK